MMPYAIGGIALVVIVMWLLSTKHILGMFNENINNAMSQVGMQLANRWNMLSALLDLTKSYAAYEHQTFADSIKARQPINAANFTQDASAQDNILIQVMERIMVIVEQYPIIKADPSYQTTMDSLNQYEGMMHQSRLVYNDGVATFNHYIGMFPTSLVAGVLGFQRKDYLESQK